MKIHPWMLFYIFKKVTNTRRVRTKHIFLSICDHFEPLHNHASDSTGLDRVRQWIDKYPAIVQGLKDADGCFPRHTFFYPIEEYRPEIMNELADFCKSGYGEVEVHLHHDNDSSENLRKTLIDYKKLLFEKYGLLSRDKIDQQIKYGFIHGNWALDNSRYDGRRCGINNELDILKETGCYADFTMPSAPDQTQTTKINSIYYAVDDPLKPKSHNNGLNAKRSVNNNNGLLMVQGPLAINFKERKWGVLPRIENGDVSHSARIRLKRLNLWINAGISVTGAAECVFIKLYTHGCQENNREYLLKNGINDLFKLAQDYACRQSVDLHFVTAREMVNIIKFLENSDATVDFKQARNYRYVRN
ncbi:MAG: hypothetical protein WC549_04485 [Actinomycetota bacterium]